MSRKVHSVEITFKNNDHILLPASAFTFFSAQAVDPADPSVNLLSFILKTDTNQSLESFIGNCRTAAGADNTLFSRLMCRDITVVTLLREDESSNVYPVIWKSDADGENRNSLHSAYTNKGGQFCLQITRHPIQMQ